MTGIRPGEQYDPQKIARSRQRLQDLGVFASVSVEEGAQRRSGWRAPAHFRAIGAEAAPDRRRRSYSTIDGATLEGYWMHRNLFGHAESLRFDAELSGIGADDLEDFSYELATTFRRPGVFTPNTDATLKLEAEREDVDPYESTSFFGKAGLEHRFSPELLGSTALNGELDEIDDAFGNNEYLLVSLPSKLDYDGRDNQPRSDPRLSCDPGSGALRRHQRGHARARQRGRARRLLWDRRARIGWCSPRAARSARSSAATSRKSPRPAASSSAAAVRSAATSTAPSGPRENGEVVGGLSFFETSLELRFRVTDTIGIVPFIDAGAAY